MKWLLREDEAFPNLWFDASNFTTTSDDLGLFLAPLHLRSLPPELLYYIAKFLPKESAAALALTSRAFFHLLSARFFKNMGVTEHWKLILLLERDSDLMVACQPCRKLHNPFVGSRGPRDAFLQCRSRDIPCLR